MVPSACSHHPDDKLVDVVRVAQLIDERKEHATRQHLLQNITGHF